MERLGRREGDAVVRVADLLHPDGLGALARPTVDADAVVRAQRDGSVVKSPPVRWNHHDSLTVWARTMSSSMPHLQAAHWMISSVVPTKLPGDPGVDRESDARARPRVWL